jgi:two-component system, NarL family, response regulator DevR
MEKPVRVLLVDDHAVVRVGMRSLLEKSDTILVCGEAGTLEETYKMVKAYKPDVVLLDMKLPDGDGAHGCKEIKALHPESKVIILTAYSEEYTLMEAIKAGVDGYLLKNIDSGAIILAINNVIKGEAALDKSVTNSVFNHIRDSLINHDIGLTDKEKDILELISYGKTNKEIAAILFISEKTVRNYVSIIMKKINVTNRTEASRYWIGQKYLK